MQAEKFYLLSHIFISLIGALLLLAIWYHIRLRFKKLLQEDESPQRIDKGLAYLSAAVFVWVLSGIWGYLALNYSWQESTAFHGIQSFLSTLNSFFILLSLFFLDESPNFIRKNTRNVKSLSIVLILLAGTSVAFFEWFQNEDFGGVRIRFIPDFLLSVLTSVLLGVAFYRVFMRRGLMIIAGIAMVTVIAMLYSQLPEVFVKMHDDFSNHLIKIIAKSSTISIFLVMATNWVIQLASTPKSSEMRLIVSDWSLIRLSVPSKSMHDVSIDFASKTTQFKNLLRFAIRRKYGTGDQQYIEVGNRGEIDRQTYLTRIIENLNTIADADDQLERKDLFTFVGQGKYRLRIVPSNIEIDDTLLSEFISDKDNQQYEVMLNS
ncbi:MAG: hypothetical protein MK066_02600 [Crocinitomicaceae bacterium]|nr:hypothetical protein [Crocinitomicaceae bacterium]